MRCVLWMKESPLGFYINPISRCPQISMDWSRDYFFLLNLLIYLPDDPQMTTGLSMKIPSKIANLDNFKNQETQDVPVAR